MTPEAKVKAKVKAILKKLDAWHFSPVSGGFGKSGVPDIIGCLNGKLIGIECKATPKDKPTALQLKQLKAIHEHGGVALVVNCESVEGLEEELMKRCEWDMYCGERTKNAAGDARF